MKLHILNILSKDLLLAIIFHEFWLEVCLDPAQDSRSQEIIVSLNIGSNQLQHCISKCSVGV